MRQWLFQQQSYKAIKPIRSADLNDLIIQIVFTKGWQEIKKMVGFL